MGYIFKRVTGMESHIFRIWGILKLWQEGILKMGKKKLLPLHIQVGMCVISLILGWTSWKTGL